MSYIYREYHCCECNGDDGEPCKLNVLKLADDFTEPDYCPWQKEYKAVWIDMTKNDPEDEE